MLTYKQTGVHRSLMQWQGVKGGLGMHFFHIKNFGGVGIKKNKNFLSRVFLQKYLPGQIKKFFYCGVEIMRV